MSVYGIGYSWHTVLLDECLCLCIKHLLHVYVDTVSYQSMCPILHKVYITYPYIKFIITHPLPYNVAKIYIQLINAML